MKLDWKRAGQASIAAIGETYTAVVTYQMDGPEDDVPWELVLRDNKTGQAVVCLYCLTREQAETQAEKQADEYDKPEWREDREGWLGSTVWKNVQLAVRSYEEDGERVWVWGANLEGASESSLPSKQAAMKAAERYVRNMVPLS